MIYNKKRDFSNAIALFLGHAINEHFIKKPSSNKNY